MAGRCMLLYVKGIIINESQWNLEFRQFESTFDICNSI